jgi:antirestriction protein ArdC
MKCDMRVAGLRERVLELAAAVADPSQGDATFDHYVSWMGQLYGSRYSFGNTCLILSQLPQSRIVAGYKRWGSLGRQVRYGSRGAAIIVPLQGKPIEEYDPLTEEVVTHRPVRHFGVAHVFDVSQTDGPPVPNFRIDLGQQAGVLLEAALSVARERGIEVEFAPIFGGANGMSKGGQIIVSSAIPVGIQAQTIFHELAHEQLHPLEVRTQDTKALHEAEADAVACVVTRHFGYDCVTNNAAAYVRNHGASAQDILASLDRITGAAHSLISGVRTHLPAELTPADLALASCVRG